MSPMQASPTIFHFEDPIEFLNFELKRRQNVYAKFSLRAWSRQLGYENPSFLSNILKKNRRLKVNVAGKIAESLGLSAKERRYFELIVLRHASESEAERRVLHRMISRCRPGGIRKLEDFPMEKFEFASEWYHWVILELFYLKGFRPTIEGIQARLGREVTKKSISDSLKKLLALGFLEKTSEGTLARASENPIFMRSFPSWAVRMFHQTMLDKAKKAIEEMGFERRNLRGTMVALNRKQYEQAIEIVSEAHQKVLALAAEGDADDVYHFSSQIFPVTTENKELVH